jgi:perosamine synthetase
MNVTVAGSRRMHRVAHPRAVVDLCICGSESAVPVPRVGRIIVANGSGLTETLAIEGGTRSVDHPEPHVRWPILGPETPEAVQRYLHDGHPLSIADGAGIIGQLEAALAEVLGLRHVLTTNSGTSALHAAYLALDLPPGSAVLTPVTTFHASVTPALHCGLRPVLVDVEPETGNLSPAALEEAYTADVSCVVVNHTWGHPADLDGIVEFCRRRGLPLIEDCAHAYLSEYDGRPVGTFGDVAVFSMQGNKMLPAGEGGFLVTPHRPLFERAMLAGHYRGRSRTQVTDPALRRFSDTGLGLKHRLHPLVAVIAYAELQRLPQVAASRVRWLAQLDDALQRTPGIQPPVRRSNVVIGAPFGYKPAYVPDELVWKDQPLGCDDYISILEAEGLEVHRPSVRPLDGMPLFTEVPPLRAAAGTWRPRTRESFPGCDAYFENRLSFPTFTAADAGPLVQGYIDALAKVARILQPEA